MARLLYSATTADGTRTEGFVNAPSAVAAREQLEQQGLKQVVLQQEVAVPQDEAELQGLDSEQQRELARFKLQLLQSPGLRTVLAEQARRSRWWLLLALAVLIYGLVRGKVEWIVVGALAGLAPLVLTVWNHRHADRYQRLLREHAVGNWDAVRVLAKELRSTSAGKPDLDFDLDLRLASIYARDHALADALQRVEPWRKRLATKPGVFEMRVAAVHLAAGDSAGFVTQMAKSHALNPQDPARLADHALAQARFGSIEQADQLLAGLDTTLLPPHGQGFVYWARGLVQLRRAQPEAEATLSQAVAAFIQLQAQPAAWTALAMAACDHAIAMHQAGQHAAARARVAEVWPILEAHATVPLLRMLEADDLLPPRRALNT